MPELKIDLDRDIMYEVPVGRRPRGGVVCRRDPETGADVFMYRNEPGVFYSANGLEVSPILAKKAGFDIERLAKAREKQVKMREFEANWNISASEVTKRIIKERNNFRLVDLGDNRYIVEDTEGQNMTAGKQATTEQQGLDWLEFFAGPEKVVSDGDISGAGGQSKSGTDRRSAEDGRAGGVLGKPVDKKATVPA